MSKLRELIIKISANSTSFQSEIARAARLGEQYHNSSQQGSRRSAAATRESQRALAAVSEQLNETRTRVMSLAGAFSGGFATASLIKMADDYNSLSARIKLATTSASDFTNVQKKLMEISQHTGTALSDNAALFSRTAASLREWGYGSEDILKLTDALSTGLQVSGASAGETSSMIVQLSQALGRGVLRGQDFNSVSQSGQRIMKALSDGMGVAQKDLKGMADEGKLTTDKIVPALISQLGKLKDEYNSMPNSVSAASTRISNAFMEWVGGANQASGATAAISGVMDDVATNIDNVATAAGGLVAIGVARYFGAMVTGATGAAAALINNTKAEIAFAAAQVRSTQVAILNSKAKISAAAADLASAQSTTVRGAQLERLVIAEAKVTAAQERLNVAISKGVNIAILDAKSRLDKAKASLVAVKAMDAEAAAQRRLNAEQAKLKRNIDANAAAQNNLNNRTSVGSRLVSGTLGLVGGIPGAVMLGAGAWYYMHQRQEQARKSAREYADTIDEIRDKAVGMSLSQLFDSKTKTNESLSEQNRLIDEQTAKVKTLQNTINGYQEMLNNPGPVIGGTMINHFTGVEEAEKGILNLTGELIAEQVRLNELQGKAVDIQLVLEELKYQEAAQKRWNQAQDNMEIQARRTINIEAQKFNQLLSMGNTLLASRQTLITPPFRIAAAVLDDKQKSMLNNAARDREIAGMNGKDKVIKQAKWELDDAGFKDTVDYRDHRDQYIADKVKAYEEREKLNNALKAGNSITNTSARVAEQYSSKIADLSVAIEVQKVRALEGEKAASLYSAAHEVGMKWTNEQRKSIQASAAQLAEWTHKADEAIRKQREMADALRDLKDASRKLQDDANLSIETRGMGDRERGKYDEFQQIDRVFNKTDKGAEALIARNQALDALNQKYYQAKVAEMDWAAGVSVGLSNWVDEATNYAGQVANATQSAMTGMVDNVADALNGNKADWKDWSVDVLKSVQKVALNMALVQSMKAAGSYFGGGFGSFISGLVPNAKGGVYDSPSLSAYSGQVVNTPTMFAFAKGAGLMGEAGPEAIMPLTRGADGSLGVRVIGLEKFQAENSESKTQITTSSGALVNINVGDINLISEGEDQQPNMGDLNGAKEQLRSTILNTVSSEMGRQGTALYRLVKEIR